MPRAKFTIEVELEDEDCCDGCPCLYWPAGIPICSLKHRPTLKRLRPDSCKANDAKEGLLIIDENQADCSDVCMDDAKAEPENEEEDLNDPFVVDKWIRGRELE